MRGWGRAGGYCCCLADLKEMTAIEDQGKVSDKTKQEPAVWRNAILAALESMGEETDGYNRCRDKARR